MGTNKNFEKGLRERLSGELRQKAEENGSGNMNETIKHTFGIDLDDKEALKEVGKRLLQDEEKTERNKD